MPLTKIGGMASTPRAGVRVAVLGPVMVEGRTGSLVEPSGALGKSLIVSLVLARGGALSAAALIDELWGDEPPRQGKAALQTLISRVRAECADGLLVSRNGDYAIAAAIGAKQGGEHADGGGLARAVRAEHAVDGAGANAEVYAVDCTIAAEGLDESVGLDGPF